MIYSLKKRSDIFNTITQHNSKRKFRSSAVQCVSQKLKDAQYVHSGTIPLTGERGGGDVKNATPIGKMCLCTQNIKNRWTCRRYFARIRHAPQEAKWARAPFAFMIASGSALAVESVVTPLAQGEEP